MTVLHPATLSTICHALRYAICGVLLVGPWQNANAQDVPTKPIVWELIEDSLQVTDLSPAGDSTVYFTGNGGTWAWRQKGPGRFVEINENQVHDRVTMASNGRFFFVSDALRMSVDYGLTALVAVERGEAFIETHSRALVSATDNLGVERSTDGGDTWTVIGRQDPVFQSVFGRAFAQSNPTPDRPHGRLVLVGVGGAAVSYDDGLSWQASNLAQTFGYRARTVVYSRAHDAFYTYMNGPTEDEGSPNGVVRESTDGLTWTTRGRLPAGEFQFQGRLAAGEDGSLWGIMEGGQDTTAFGALYRSVDRGATWNIAARFDGRDWVGNQLDVEDVIVDTEGRVWVGFSLGEQLLFGKGAVLRSVNPIAASFGESALPEETALQGGVWPNPVSGLVHVAVDVGESQTVHVRVVDVLGREVAVVHEGLLSGSQTFTVDTARWGPGTYIVEVVWAARRETRRFVVTR